MVKKRRSQFTAITDEDDDIDKVTSYCTHCKEYGFYNLLKERIYPNCEPKPSDHENWLCCWECGTIVAKVHAQRQDEIIGIREPNDNPHDYPGKLAIAVMNKKSSDRRRNFIKNLNRPDHSNQLTGPDGDQDIQRMIDNGKELISYSDNQQD